MISEVEILDESQGQRYREVAADSIALYGGRYLVRGAEPDVPEGEWPDAARVVIVEDVTACGNSATLAHMSTIASRDLRNHTAEVLRQVSGGTHVTITVNGLPVAEISPIRSARKQFLSKTDLIEILTRRQADPGLREDLEILTSETTDDLDPL